MATFRIRDGPIEVKVNVENVVLALPFILKHVVPIHIGGHLTRALVHDRLVRACAVRALALNQAPASDKVSVEICRWERGDIVPKSVLGT